MKLTNISITLILRHSTIYNNTYLLKFLRHAYKYKNYIRILHYSSPQTKQTSLQETYEGVIESFRTASITKYMLTKINTRWEASQSVMAAKLTRLTHKIAIQLYLVAESCTIRSSRSRRPVRKLLDALVIFGGYASLSIPKRILTLKSEQNTAIVMNNRFAGYSTVTTMPQAQTSQHRTGYNDSDLKPLKQRFVRVIQPRH
jgi:hypothetical protein